MNGKRINLFLSRLFIGVALLAALAGCNNNPHPRPLHETRADGTPWVVSYRAIGDDPRSLDPQFSYDTLGHAIISQVYEGLLQYSPFKTDPYELEPCLAEGMPRRIKNPDGTETYEIHLKRGVFFHDDPCFPGGRGRELTAADFVYTFQRIADPAVECPVLSTLQEFIAGLAPAYDEARLAKKFDYSKPTGAITVVDDHTLRLNLLKPYPQIQYWLAMPFTAPVPREAVEFYDGKDGRDQFKFHPVGTGPYRMAQWSRSRLIRLARHERYAATRFPEGGWPSSDDALLRPLAGAALPRAVTLDVIAGNAESRQRAEFDQLQFQQLGIRCKIEENTWSRFQEKQLRGLFELNTGSGWNADYPDPENFFFLFYSKNVPPQGSNYTRFSTPGFDRLFEQMATMDNGPERLEIIHRMTAILVEQCPIIFTFHPVTFALNQPWMPRLFDNAMLATAKYTVVDPVLRERKIREWNYAPAWPLWALGGAVMLLIAYAVVRARKSNL